MSQIRAITRLAARAKTGAIFVKRIYLRRAIRYRPAESPPSPRDENFTFVTNCISPTALLPLHDSGRQCDCRGRDNQFSSRDFPKGDSFHDPLLIAASFTHLEFSYRTIPSRRIRFACRLIAGAKFSSRNKKARDAGFVTSKKYEAILLTKTAPLFISGSDLPQLWVQRSMDTVCEVCGSACDSLALTGNYDHHLQNDENEPHSEND